MGEVISVCIPVNNYEATIMNTMLSMNEQASPTGGELEILVCANGCTDHTEDIVDSIVSNYSNISLYSESTVSKPLAWNVLMDKAAGDQVIFTDGDVLFGRGAIDALSTGLDRTDRTLLAGRGIPYVADESWMQKKFVNMMRAEASEKGYVSGALYGFSTKRMNDVFSEAGIKSMPENVIAEDFWVESLVGEKEWELAPEATFHYRFPSWTEYYKISSRYSRARRQIRGDETLAKELSLKNPVNYYLDKFFSSADLKAKAKMVSRFFIRRAYTLASVSYSASIKHKDNAHWERAESTKRPIPLEVAYR